MMNGKPLVLSSVVQMQDYRRDCGHGQSIGFVPTMGYLHEGHLSLVKRSMSDNAITIVSIFVNPTQFGQNEDFSQYPRDIERDLSSLASLEVDAVFMPTDTEMYPDGYGTFVEVSEIGERYCGKSRPGHFRGVCTVVSKLVNIVRPDKMYVGEKDFQQAFILRNMLRDLDMSTQIVVCEIVRESDGLAMSSRNVYLDEVQRQSAVCLYQSLLKAREYFQQGKFDIESLKIDMIDYINTHGGVIDYIAFVNDVTFTEEVMLTPETRILLAVRVGNTRLIDNMRLR